MISVTIFDASKTSKHIPNHIYIYRDCAYLKIISTAYINCILIVYNCTKMISVLDGFPLTLMLSKCDKSKAGIIQD